jgi:hypothetical protein
LIRMKKNQRLSNTLNPYLFLFLQTFKPQAWTQTPNWHLSQ